MAGLNHFSFDEKLNGIGFRYSSEEAEKAATTIPSQFERPTSHMSSGGVAKRYQALLQEKRDQSEQQSVLFRKFNDSYVSVARDPAAQQHFARHLQQPVIGDENASHLSIGAKMPLAYEPAHKHLDGDATNEGMNADVTSSKERMAINPAEYMKVIDRMLYNTYMHARLNAPDHVLPGRTVIKLELSDPGKDPLVEIKGDTNYIEMVRDAGTKGEQVIKVVPVASANQIPDTREFQVIAGPYGPTGKWGFYTAFAGDEGKPFPNERQPEPVRAELKAYWDKHGFLATPDQIAYTIKQMQVEMEKNPEKAGTYGPMIEAATKIVGDYTGPSRGVIARKGPGFDLKK